MKRVVLVGGVCAFAACGPKGPSRPPVRLVSPPGANHQMARHSPDGSRLFWWDVSGQAFQLWTGPADLHDSTKVPVTSLFPVPTIWSPDGKQIAVASSEGGLANVVVISADGGAPRRLTQSSGLAVPTGWNPDGDRVSYIATASAAGGGTFQSIFTSLAHGGSTPMLPGESRPAFAVWSPDGRRIAYNLTEGSKNTIWVADSAGGNRRQLTTDGFEAFGQGDFAWSPDSREIVYESRRTGTSDIWVVPADSGGPRQLTKDVRNDASPIWSPDGKWIAFVSDRGKQTDLWVVPAAGGVEQRITNDRDEEALLQWNKGNNQLVYLTGRGQTGVWSLPLAGGVETRLTPDSIHASNPQVSPDGKQIVFGISHGGGLDDIAVMPVTGGPWRVLVQGGSNTSPTWSPDGSRIAFSSDRGGTQDIWMVDMAGGEPRQLVSWPSNDRNPAWNIDGSAIYFVSDHDTRLGDLWRVAVGGGEPVRVTQDGGVSGFNVTRGHPDVYVTTVATSGRFVLSRVSPDGSLKSVWDRSNAFPGDLLPAGDSLLLYEIQAGGGFANRIISANSGDGPAILKPGDNGGDLSHDGTQMLYYATTGATQHLAILNRKDGSTRPLTKATGESENSGNFTPDGKTVVFARSRSVRRIAIADLTKLLASTPH